ncbi:MAG: hypothetical protein R8L58_05950, partial [Mariprofundaceae bacterium]
GHKILDDIHLDMRDIGPDRETLWELQAQQDEQSLRGHGRMDFRRGEVTKGFGKLKLSQVSVTALQPFAPDILAGWFSSSTNHLSGTLTLDITGRQAWSVFGEMALQSSRFKQPLRLRGKLTHPNAERMEWRDSFIHFDDKTAIAINGECLQSKCNSSVEAKKMPLATWMALLPEMPEDSRRFIATTDMHSDIRWQPDGWQASARIQLDKPAYRSEQGDITLPDISIEKARASGNKTSWRIGGTAAFASSDDRLNFTLNSNSKTGSLARLQSDRLADSWPALANMLLAVLHEKPELKGAGFISGSIELAQNASKHSLQMDLDARNAAIHHPLFVKPAATIASCKASLHWWGEGNDSHVDANLDQCQLHTSKVRAMQWQSDAQNYTLSSKGLSIDFDALQKQSIRLPARLQPFHGQLNGSFSSQWAGTSLWPWVEQAQGSLNLQRLGTSLWQASGAMQARQGNFHTEHLHIKGVHGNVDLKGSYDFSRHAGKLDILSANLDWIDMPGMPDIWHKVQLSGHIQQTHLKLLANTWQEISSSYKLKDGALTLRKMQANLGGGTIASPKLKLKPMPGGLAIEGKLRAKAIRLTRLSNLDAWLGIKSEGYLHANLQLKGTLPVTRLGDWKGSNGDILIYGGSWAKLPDSTNKAGLITAPLNAHTFKKLEGRFRVHGGYIDIRGTRLKQGKQLYRGSARMDPNGEVTGTFAEDGALYQLSGHWPKLHWSIQEKK